MSSNVLPASPQPIRRWKGKKRVLAILLLIIVVFVGTLGAPRWRRWKDHLSYATRPFWDVDEAPRDVIPHFGSDHMKIDEKVCELHGWEPRKDKVDIWDAILYSNEFHLLLLRLHSLPTVTKHIILLSNTTFTGLPLPYQLPAHSPDAPSRALPQELLPFSKKLYIFHHAGRALADGEDPFNQEGEVRRAMTGHINDLASHFHSSPLILMSDLDELPTQSALLLTQRCMAPSPLHLQLEQFLYSFEWSVGTQSWRAAVVRWDEEGRERGYGHGKKGEQMLSAAGVHCSFCFPKLQDFRTKLTAYSHHDRLYNTPNWESVLTDKHIQETICSGTDLVGMLPEAYRWKDLLAWHRPDRNTDFTSNLFPSYLLEHTEKFEFLLPGGCVRKS